MQKSHFSFDDHLHITDPNFVGDYGLMNRRWWDILLFGLWEEEERE